MDPGSSDLTENEDTGASEEEVAGSEGVSEKSIPKPKGEVGRPGQGGYNLAKALSWSEKTYDNVLVSKCGVYTKESPSHRLQGTRHKCCQGKARLNTKLSRAEQKESPAACRNGQLLLQVPE